MILLMVQSTIRHFADDCLTYRCISSPADQCILQEDLNRPSTWLCSYMADGFQCMWV